MFILTMIVKLILISKTFKCEKAGVLELRKQYFNTLQHTYYQRNMSCLCVKNKKLYRILYTQPPHTHTPSSLGNFISLELCKEKTLLV